MLTGLHFVLSYSCTLECDHCFLYCSPRAKGTFTLEMLKRSLVEAAKVKSVEWIYFEGGEPFLYYPLMIEGIRIARGMGFKTGVVTNAYWATSLEDADLWLKALGDLGINDISLSNDEFHYDKHKDNPATIAFASAERLGLPVSTICIEAPRFDVGKEAMHGKGEPVVGGDVVFRGRAVEKLTDGLPRRRWEELAECKLEDLREPGRVHLDSYGNVQVCQGLSLGNMWETPLSELMRTYDPDSHPICGPLLRGGPAKLAAEYGVAHDGGYVDECHFCYMLRRALLKRFPACLGPRQVYGYDD